MKKMTIANAETIKTQYEKLTPEEQKNCPVTQKLLYDTAIATLTSEEKPAEKPVKKTQKDRNAEKVQIIIDNITATFPQYSISKNVNLASPPEKIVAYIPNFKSYNKTIVKPDMTQQKNDLFMFTLIDTYTVERITFYRYNCDTATRLSFDLTKKDFVKREDLIYLIQSAIAFFPLTEKA